MGGRIGVLMQCVELNSWHSEMGRHTISGGWSGCISVTRYALLNVGTINIFYKMSIYWFDMKNVYNKLC